jgi:orotate phosphoribosyltransferase
VRLVRQQRPARLELSVRQEVPELAVRLGLRGRDVVVLLDRQEGARERLRQFGYNLISILGLETMLNYLMASGLIDEERYRKSIDYIQSRRAERTA